MKKQTFCFFKFKIKIFLLVILTNLYGLEKFKYKKTITNIMYVK